MAQTNQPNQPDNEETGTTEKPVYMDDTTGSDGGATESNPDELTESRSDTGRVEGPGISGGTGDSDTAQSGGRSQY